MFELRVFAGFALFGCLTKDRIDKRPTDIRPNDRFTENTTKLFKIKFPYIRTDAAKLRTTELEVNTVALRYM